MSTEEVDYEARFASLEKRVAFLEGKRPGRKPKPIVVSEDGVCGVDPARDSTTCPDASLYRRQKGCQGTACKQLSHDYYSEYRKTNP